MMMMIMIMMMMMMMMVVVVVMTSIVQVMAQLSQELSELRQLHAAAAHTGPLQARTSHREVQPKEPRVQRHLKMG